MLSKKGWGAGQTASASQLRWGIPGTEQVRGGSSRDRRGEKAVPGRLGAAKGAQSLQRPDQWPLVCSHMTLPRHRPLAREDHQWQVRGDDSRHPQKHLSHCGQGSEVCDPLGIQNHELLMGWEP